MKMLQQLDRAHKISKAKQITFENVRFKNGFTAFLDALAVDRLIEHEWSGTQTRNGWVWNDYRHRDGVLVETATNPNVYKTSVTVSGSNSALLKVKSLMEAHAEYDGSPRPEDIDVTYQYHDSLHDDLWDRDGETYTLKPDVRDKLLENAEAFFSFLKVEDLDVDDVVLTGSAANFNWTENSDVDLHLIVDMDQAEKLYGPIVREYFDTKKRLWNDLHSIEINGFPVEFYVEAAGEGHVSTGVYSIQNDEWVIEPKHEEPSVDDGAVRVKAAELIRDVQDVLTSNKADAIETLIEKLRKMRQAGLDRAGEFSTENLAYKILRNGGWLEKLYDCKTKVFDRALSVEEEEWSHYR